MPTNQTRVILNKLKMENKGKFKLSVLVLILILNLNVNSQILGKSLHKYDTYKTDQKITYSFENAKISSEGDDYFYEVDIYVKSNVEFKMGIGQFYFDYNSLAFGENIQKTENLTVSFPDGSILGERVANVLDVYKPVINDATNSKLSIAWIQNVGEQSISLNTNEKPTLLAHIKIKYENIAESSDVTFDTRDSFTKLTHTASSTTMSGDGVQLTNDSYDSFGAIIINNWLNNNLSTSRKR